MDQDLKSQLANLHDAFLNASLQRSQMSKEPLELDPHTFMVSNRGRLERTWIAFLYVLVECWRSKQMEPVRDFILTRIPDCKIDQLLQEGEQKGLLDKLREVRNYMCHRDKREYWNEGRLAVAGNLNFNTRLHDEFSRVLLTALEMGKQEDRSS